MGRLGVCACLTVMALGSFGADVEVDGDGALRVDGERRFVIGMYEGPKDEAAAAELAEAGFNLVQCSATQDSLELARAQGLGAWVNVGGRVRVSDESGANALRDSVGLVKDHSALWVWEVPDEALWNLYYPRLQNATKRWDELGEKVRGANLAGDRKKALEAAYERFSTYRGSARYAEADAEEKGIRERLGMPSDYGPLLSTWRDEVEPLRAGMSEGCRVIREADGNHPIWFNHAPRNTIADLNLFGEIADIAGCDIYPVPLHRRVGHSDIGDRNLSSVGAYTRRMAAGAPGKAVWMVLQGFAWADINENFDLDTTPRPTYYQTRFMVYDAIVNGARGILYWGTAYIEKDSQLWGDLKRMAGELRGLEPLLAARDVNWPVRVTLDATPNSVERDVLCVVRCLDDRCLLVAVNETGGSVAFTIQGLDAIEGRTFQVTDSWEKLTVKNGSIRFGLPAQDCAVLVME